MLAGSLLLKVRNVSESVVTELGVRFDPYKANISHSVLIYKIFLDSFALLSLRRMYV